MYTSEEVVTVTRTTAVAVVSCGCDLTVSSHSGDGAQKRSLSYFFYGENHRHYETRKYLFLATIPDGAGGSVGGVKVGEGERKEEEVYCKRRDGLGDGEGVGDGEMMT